MRNVNMRQLLLAMTLVGGGLLSTSAIAAGGVQCWTDNQGHRACGDTVPPQYAKQQREVFDEQGRVRQVKPREKTEAEVAAEEADRKSTRLNPVTNAQIVCRILLE